MQAARRSRRHGGAFATGRDPNATKAAFNGIIADLPAAAMHS
jgi:hypothetical protein